MNNPPPTPRGGPPGWTRDSTKRVVGWKGDSPQSLQEKVEASHDPATDDAVTSVATTDVLRRPSPPGPHYPHRLVRLPGAWSR